MFNYEKVFRYLDTDRAKNSITLSENEMRELLQFMFELGILYDKVSAYTLDSYIQKFYNRFSYKKGLQLFYFLQTISIFSPNKFYKPNELNKLISTNFRNLVPDLLYNFGLINYEQFYSIKKDDSNLIRPRELTELLHIMTDELMVLEKMQGIEYLKEKNDNRPGRKKKKEIKNYEGFPSSYKLSSEYVIIKDLFNKSEFLLLVRNFINKNESIKNHLIFTLNTMFFNSSKLMNINIKSEDRERLKNELFKKGNAKLIEDITQVTSFVLLLGSNEEIKNFSKAFIEDNLSSNDYTFILFLIKLSGLINKINIKKSKLKVEV